MCTLVVVLVSEIGSKFATFECDKIAFMPNDPLTGSVLLDRARKIKLFLMDIDGTLTDGGVCLISLPNNGCVAEMKVFNSQDGLGLTLAHTMGIKTGFITGRHSSAVSQRAQESHVDFVYLGQADKTAAFEDCMRKAQVSEDEVAYMGDDLPRPLDSAASRVGDRCGKCGPRTEGDQPLCDQEPGRRGNRARGSRAHFDGAGKVERGNSASAGLNVTLYRVYRESLRQSRTPTHEATKRRGQGTQCFDLHSNSSKCFCNNGISRVDHVSRGAIHQSMGNT